MEFVDKHFGYNGSPSSMLIQLIRKYGYNRGLTANIYVVSKANPLTFRDVEGLEFPPQLYHINTDLLRKTETVLIDGEPKTIEYPNEINVGDKFLALCNEDVSTMPTYIVMKL